MRKMMLSACVVLFTAWGLQAAPKKFELKSPDGSIQLSVSLNKNAELEYQVSKNGEVVIQPSQLGIKGDQSFTKGLKISKLEKAKRISQSYSSPAEKRAQRSFTANGRDMIVKNKAGKKLRVEFAVSDEGVAFRYLYDSKTAVAVRGEKTSFKFDAQTRAWLHPHADAQTGWANTQPSYEEQYQYNVPVGFPAPLKAGWSFPALFNTGKYWVLLSESGLTPNYVGTRLAKNSPNGEYFIEFPQKRETIHEDHPEYVVSANVVSPWRLIVIGSLADVVESQMVTDFSPEADASIDYSWVKPGISSWSWGQLKDNFTVYPVQKLFIEYSSKMKWDYCLVDADWDRKIGYDSIQMLVDLGKELNVGVLLWYNSSGRWNTTPYTPKHKLVDRDARRAEFKRIHEMGVKGVKVDFWPGDGQSTIQYYYDMMKDAAEFKLLLNFHGTTVPRGWSRTFPHLMTMESIRGYEFMTFEQSDADMGPKHMNMAPYARNVVGPMDFTPVAFGEMIGKQRRTWNGFELGLTVVFQSGIQHFVEVPESMYKQPDYVQDYMRRVPRTWDDVVLLDGYPGKYTVMARRSGSSWFIGGINGETEARELTLDLSRLKVADRELTILTDGSHSREFSQQQAQIAGGKMKISMKALGGFVTVIE